MEKTKKRHSKKRKYIGIILLVVLLVASALIFLKIWEERQSFYPETGYDEENVIEYNGDKYSLKGNVETFLVLGLDKFETESKSESYNNDKLADFIMLFVFDKDAENYTAIHINRDTMTDVNILGVAGNKVDSVQKQISTAHTYGNGKDVSCRNVADSVSKLLLGVNVNHYVSFTMDAVPIMNDLVGGVEVTVLDDFTGIDDALVKDQTVRLQGEQALKYVRSRYGMEDNTNLARMKRQQQYIISLQKSFNEKVNDDEEFLAEAGVKLSDYVVSDRSITQMQDISKRFNDYEFGGVIEFDGESKKGKQFMEFYPNAESVEKTVIDLFYEKVN